MKAFITGINGFTGRHLAKFLGQQNVRVTGADLKRAIITKWI